MTLTQDEQAVLNSLNEKHFKLISKFFIRPLEVLPDDFQNITNEALGEIVKAQVVARFNNKHFLSEMKGHVATVKDKKTPVAPE